MPNVPKDTRRRSSQDRHRRDIAVAAVLLLISGCDLFGSAVDERAPSVTIVHPYDQATTAGRFVKIFVAADARGTGNYISFVNVMLNGARIGEASFEGNTYTYLLNSKEFDDGTYRMEAVAFDRNESRGISAPITIQIENEGGPTGPDVHIVAPTGGEELLGTARVIARAQEGSGAVSRLDLLVDGVPAATSADPVGDDTFVFDWETNGRPPGEHTLQVKAYGETSGFRVSEGIVVRTSESNPEEKRAPGSVLWRTGAYSGEVRGSVAIGFNNDLYVGSSSDTLYAFSDSGAPKWKFATRGPIRSAPVVGNNEDVFVTSEDGRLYGLNSDGSPLWQPYETGSALRATPALGVEGTLFFGDGAGRLHAVRSFDGRTSGGNWPVDLSSEAIAAPVVIAGDRTLYVATTGGRLHAVGPDGEVLWRSETLIGGVTSGMALTEEASQGEAVLYVVSNDGSLYAFSGRSGSILWEHALAGPLRSSPIVGPDGIVYVGTSTGLAALNPDPDASPRLRFIHPADDVGTPVIDSNGTIHFTSRDRLHAINANNTPFWQYGPEAGSDAPLSLRRDGALILAALNGILTGFETGSVGLADGFWPMYQRNGRHTGRLGIDAGD